MAKPVLRFKVNKQSSEVGGRYYGIIEDTPVTPENSILQICEFKKITAFSPEQVLRLVEDVCDGAAKLVARDGQSRQLSSLLKFSPRSRGTFNSEDSRWTNQRLIVGARLLKDIKLEMNPSDFVMSNVADVGILTSAAWSTGPTLPITVDTVIPNSQQVFGLVRVNGSKLRTWDASNTFAELRALIRPAGSTEVEEKTFAILAATLSDFADNGFSVTLRNTDLSAVAIQEALSLSAGATLVGLNLVIKHPDEEIEFKALALDIE